MKIKTGTELMAFDHELERFVKAKIKSIDGNLVTLEDIDLSSEWYGQIWQDQLWTLNDEGLYKFIKKQTGI